MNKRDKIIRDEFEDLLSGKLKNFSMEVSEDDWTIIERGMGAPAKRPIPLLRYFAVAASLVVVSVLGFYLSKNSDTLIVPTQVKNLAEKPALYINDDDNNSSVSAIEAVTNLKTVIEHSKETENRITSSIIEAIDGGSHSVVADQTIEQKDEMAPAKEQQQAATQYGNRQQQSQQNTRSGGRAFDPYFENPRRSSTAKEGWSLAMFANGKTKLSSNDAYSNKAGVMAMDGRNGILVYNSANTLATRIENSKYKHNIPLSFGLTVRKELTKRWGVETGLVYSYLSSKSELQSSFKYQREQQLHYLGIPVAATFSMYKTKTIDFYSRAGVQFDFNIGGKLTTDITNPGAESVSSTTVDRFRVKGVQVSTAVNVGIMYNISPTFGLYFEPGVGYYIKNDSQPDSYWKEHPTNFNMRLGFRATF